MNSGGLAALLGCGVGLFFVLVMLLIGLAIGAVICYQLYLTAQALPAANQKMAPWLVFLLLIPLLNFFWLFFVVLKLSEGYREYFAANPRGDTADCGQGLGLGWAIASLCIVVPFAKIFAGLASLILMILYLVKMVQLRGLVGPPASA